MGTLLAPAAARGGLCAVSSYAPLSTSASAASSSRYIARQQRDPYVKLRRTPVTEGRPGAAPTTPTYASRAAFKLLQLDDIHHFLRPSRTRTRTRPRIIVDLGAAPGGWTQVALQRAGASSARIFALDILPMDSLLVPRATCIQGDFLDADVQAALERAIQTQSAEHASAESSDPASPADDLDGDAAAALLARSYGLVDVVLSDMMAPTSGNPISDTEASLALCRSAFVFAARNLRRPSVSTTSADAASPAATTFVCKFFGSPAADEFRRAVLERAFERVKVEKGRVGASRKESREAFWVCRGYRGPQHVNVDALYA